MPKSSQVIVDLENITNTCFVVMPFEPPFDSEYKEVIKPAVRLAGLECVRGDEIYTRQAIIHDVWHSIRTARVVVAQLSGRNPNVMYEIGLAHAIGKPIVLITRDEKDMPFDLKALRYVVYDLNKPHWGTHLKKQLTDILTLILRNSSLSKHLDGIREETKLPTAPEEIRSPTLPVSSEMSVRAEVDLSGVWHGVWLSVLRDRKHDAVLAVPSQHGQSFTASMTVTYERNGQQTIVQETLDATLRDSTLTLTGVNYTYVQRGDSAGYSLDSFVLKPKDGSTLAGTAILRRGKRAISFVRIGSSPS
jgi:hypothetical protein